MTQSQQDTMDSIRGSFQMEPSHDVRVRMYWAFAIAVGYDNPTFWVDGVEYSMVGAVAVRPVP